MLLAPHGLQRPNETQLNQRKKTQRWSSDRRAITKDPPEGAGERKGSVCPRWDPGRAACPCPCPAPSAAAPLGGQGSAQEGSGAWPPSKPTEPQAAKAGPGCEQDSALKRIQSRVKDVDLRSWCRSSSSLIEQGRNTSTCSGGVSPLLRGGTGQLSRGLCSLGWTLPFNSEPCGSTMSALWMLATSLGCLGEQGWEGMHTDLPGLSGYLPANLDPQPGRVPRGTDGTETVPESILALKSGLWGT